MNLAEQARINMVNDLYDMLKPAHKLIGEGEYTQARDAVNKALHYFLNEELDEMLGNLYVKLIRQGRNSKGKLQDELQGILDYLKPI